MKKWNVKFEKLRNGDCWQPKAQNWRKLNLMWFDRPFSSSVSIKFTETMQNVIYKRDFSFFPEFRGELVSGSVYIRKRVRGVATAFPLVVLTDTTKGGRQLGIGRFGRTRGEGGGCGYLGRGREWGYLVWVWGWRWGWRWGYLTLQRPSIPNHSKLIVISS